MDDHATWSIPDERPLGEVIGYPRGVVHVPVRQADVVDRDDFARGSPHVEADVVFRRGDDRFLARQGEADDLDPIQYLLYHPAHMNP